MVQTSNAAKRQKTKECTSCTESVMFNSDSLFKIASYLPADGLLNLALTCRRLGVAPVPDGNDSLSLIEETVCRIVHDVATEEEKNALPCYDGYNWLSKYNYLQSLRIPLTFDQLAGNIVYVEGNKARVVHVGGQWATAFSNNIMMAGKHYASFEAHHESTMATLHMDIGVMRPGEAMQSAKGYPQWPDFFNNFSQRNRNRQYNNSVNCCMYSSYDGNCWSHDWEERVCDGRPWDGIENFSSPCKIGMLLDLDEGTLSVYKNDRKLGAMKRGLSGHYCWVVSLTTGTQVTIKRGTVPES